MIKTLIERFDNTTRYQVWYLDRPLRYIYAYKGLTGPAWISTASIATINLRDAKRLLSALEELIDQDVFGDPSK